MQEYAFNIIVCNADDDPLKEQKHIEVLMAKQVDGLILFYFLLEGILNCTNSYIKIISR